MAIISQVAEFEVYLHPQQGEDEDEEEEEEEEGEDGPHGAEEGDHKVPQGRPVPGVTGFG